jgi:surfeit locus 1 family protein
MRIDERSVEPSPLRSEQRAWDGWPRMLPTFATIAAVAVFVAAGNWQRGRMEAKQALRAQLDAAMTAAPVALPANVADWTAWRFRPVTATGVFDAARQILIDNKVHAGVVGYAVVTPLALTDGRAVLVDRGFVAAGPSRAALPAAAPPEGEVTVRGRVNLVPSGYFELGREDTKGPVWQHLDPRRFAAATGIPVLPIVIESMAPTGGGDQSLARDRAPPDLGIEKHRIYMWQWYMFAAMAIGLWLWFTLRRPSRGAHS